MLSFCKVTQFYWVNGRKGIETMPKPPIFGVICIYIGSQNVYCADFKV
ncbi:hypothetical protein BACDOR_04340 [Phocaeicola dorei DSM 17855]|uniref:Uncharacterized protein n=1 Tax=Phocaeicola dorei DSM 17855 TaxID=483217 RepID=B6W443_9BACT|nr:hypothetical protein BACDOR_04340 [Phocaeicola dorei DSM 17855]